MPRTARVDHPGAIHHVVSRGVERRAIFRGDRDRAEFVERLSTLVRECEADCFAWALVPNHFHLVLRTGATPLGTLMARLGGGYAIWFNLRHDRSGHLFQNRYYSEPILSEEHFLCAVRYVHRNPLEAGLVADLGELGEYPWSGHRALVDPEAASFEAVDEVLGRFGSSPAESRSRLMAWMDGVGTAARREDPATAEIETAISTACARFGVDSRELRSGVRRRSVSRARALVAHMACDLLGVSQSRVARELGVSEAAIHRARARGRLLLRAAPKSQEVNNVP